MHFIDELLGLFSSQLSVIKTVFSMTKLEAKLALLSVYPLIINVLMLLVILMGTWLIAMSLLGYGLLQVINSVTWVLLAMLVLNLLVLGLLVSYLFFNLKNMSFEKTRAYLLRDNHESKKTVEVGNNAIEPAMGEPTTPAQ